VLEERISVKRANPVIEYVLVTPEGPVIGPALEGDPGAISMRATWLEPRRLRGLLDLVKLRTAEDFHTRLGDFPSSSMNVVFATVDGRIGWQLVGEPPARRAGFGAFPVSGADPEAGWDDVVPFDRMPRALDPACGWIATANAKPAAGDEGPFISADFADGHRLARIGERLAERRDWDLEGMADIQLDVLSIPWREIRDIVLDAPPISPAATELLKVLADWDGRVGSDSAGATIFEMLIAELARMLATAKAPHSVETVMGRGFSALVPAGAFEFARPRHVIRSLCEQPESWLDEPWPPAIARALDRVGEGLHARFGHKPTEWAWGRVRPLRFLHPAGNRRLLDRVFNLGPLPGFGDANTVAQGAVRFAEPTTNPDMVPMLRMVIDVGRWDRSRWALPGGQSGNPCSPHYDDQIPMWQRAMGIAIPWTEAEVKAATRHALRLPPAKASVRGPEPDAQDRARPVVAGEGTTSANHGGATATNNAGQSGSP
jgi:penicillin amidase